MLLGTTSHPQLLSLLWQEFNFFSGKVFGKQESKSSTSVALDAMHHCNCWFHAIHQLSSNLLDVIASVWKNIFPNLPFLSQPATSTSAPVESWCCECLEMVGDGVHYRQPKDRQHMATEYCSIAGCRVICIRIWMRFSCFWSGTKNSKEQTSGSCFQLW